MSGYNRVILMGNLTRDPELRYTPQGTAVADLSLAVNTPRGGRGQDRKEDTLFIDITVWDRQAETCSEYLAKGRSVLVEGRLVQDQWEDRETGQKRSKIKVVANTVRFIGGGGGGGGGRASGGGSGRGGYGRQDAQRGPAPSQNSGGQGGGESFDDFDGDDIPF